MFNYQVLDFAGIFSGLVSKLCSCCIRFPNLGAGGKCLTHTIHTKVESYIKKCLTHTIPLCHRIVEHLLGSLLELMTIYLYSFTFLLKLIFFCRWKNGLKPLLPLNFTNLDLLPLKLWLGSTHLSNFINWDILPLSPIK